MGAVGAWGRELGQGLGLGHSIGNGMGMRLELGLGLRLSRGLRLGHNMDGRGHCISLDLGLDPTLALHLTGMGLHCAPHPRLHLAMPG